MAKKILFLTGSRADFGKLKSLIRCVDSSPLFEYTIFATGMHTLSKYGYTVDEVYKTVGERRLSEGFRSVYTFINQVCGESMDRVLANTILGLSRYVQEFNPDLIVVHGDRVEALAGAIVGSLRNILVAHVEGGEKSGTIDELIRHAISKLSHVHFVSNVEAANRLKQLGEHPESIFVIGSPDIDLMLSTGLPSIRKVKEYYGITFDKYGIVLFHPVTTDLACTASTSQALISALIQSKYSYVVISPNNDEGCEYVFSAYERLKGNPRFAQFSSMRVEYFLTLLKNSSFIIGNSSAGIHESPIYGLYSINIETRQKNRFNHESIVNVDGNVESISKAIECIEHMPKCEPSYHFGKGNSSRLFMTALKGKRMWEISKQKQFIDVGCESDHLVVP